MLDDASHPAPDIAERAAPTLVAPDTDTDADPIATAGGDGDVREDLGAVELVMGSGEPQRVVSSNSVVGATVPGS